MNKKLCPKNCWCFYKEDEEFRLYCPLIYEEKLIDEVKKE